MIKNVDGLIEFVGEELKKTMDVAVVGLSGGADSTLVALLCTKALGKENVYGVHMPYAIVDYETFNDASVKLANHLGINSLTVPISSPVDALDDKVKRALGEPLSQLNHGNMRSRIRMVTLYAVCKHIEEQTGKRARVVGTDNLSESFIFYYTLWGDGSFDSCPISSLFKSEVYQLLDYFRDNGDIPEELINRKPSAGLWQGQTDAEELGASYDDMEVSIRKIMNGEELTTPVDFMVQERHVKNSFKGTAPFLLDTTMFLDH